MRFGMVYCGDVMAQRAELQFSTEAKVALITSEDLKKGYAEVDVVIILWDGVCLDMLTVRSLCAELGLSYVVVGRPARGV